jgi:hypothetical protein
MEWTDHKPYLRLHQLPVEEFSGTTMVARLDFAAQDFAELLKQQGATTADPARSVSAQ